MPGVVLHVLVEFERALPAAHPEPVLLDSPAPTPPRDRPTPFYGVYTVFVPAPDKGFGEITVFSLSHINGFGTAPAALFSSTF
jgi:hypothetical protein